MGDTASSNLQWAFALLDGLAAAGVERVVISPGSRSTPLVLACRQHPSLQDWVLVDERSAAFFALGMARATQTPVAVIATSGSAPAHWYPAVIEADQSAIPLLLLSADRPPELQDCGANQTINQLNLFQQAVRAFHPLSCADGAPNSLNHVRNLGIRAAHQSQWPLPGPVHINIPFREPLVPEQLPALTSEMRAVPVEVPSLLAPGTQLDRIAGRIDGQPGLIVCGPGNYAKGFAAALAQLADALNCPVLADPLSGLRFGTHDRSRILCRYDAFLQRDAFTAHQQPQWLLRFGAMPVSRALLQYLDGVEPGRLLLVEPGGRWPDPLHQVGELLRATPANVCTGLATRIATPAAAAWIDAWRTEEQRAATLADNAACLEAHVVAVLRDSLPAGSILFSGNSLPLRELDSFSGSAAKPLHLLANRGASGIDGNVSTLLGIASAVADNSKVVGLIGDLAFYHDMNGLLAARHCDATLIIINNDGGGIFRYLPQAGQEDFDRYWQTATGLDFEHAARLYQLPFRRVSDREGFARALGDSLEQPGVKLIEVIVDPQQSVDAHRAYRDRVSQS